MLLEDANCGLRTGFRSLCIRYGLGIVCIAGLAPALLGQTLRLSSASASRGDQITIELSLDAPAGSAPVALQWDTKVPVALGPIDDKSFTGATAPETGKSLSCAMKEKGAAAYTARCILAGGQNPIPNGPLSRLRLRIPMNAPVGEAHVHMENVTAVSREAKAVSLAPIDTVVLVRK